MRQRRLRLRMGRPGEAEAECHTAVEIEQKLVAEHPDVIFYRDRLVDSLTCLGEVVRARGRAAAATPSRGHHAAG